MISLSRQILIALAAAAAIACGDERVATGSSITVSGPDAILVRLPADGGNLRAYRAGQDSVLWTSRDRTPAVERILGFDDFLGLVILREPSGHVSGIDLRLGTSSRIGGEALPGNLVSEGAAVYALDGEGRVLRATPAGGGWSWAVPGGAKSLVPTPDGSLLVIAANDAGSSLRRVVPPDTRTLDSTTLGPVRFTVRTQAGDRLWAVTDKGLVSLRTRDLSQAFTHNIRDSVVAVALTPSGDRIFVATDEDELRIVDRYREDDRGGVDLPGRVSDLRMDPDGNYLLAKSADFDSAYVVSIGTARVVATLATKWRDDLPLITPDGRVLTLLGDDAVLVDAESARERMRYRGGASDRWHLLRWNGFRPRSAGLDRPVEFEEYAADSAAADSALTAMIYGRYGDLSGIGRAAPMEPQGESPAPTAPREERESRPDPREDGRGTWTVSFATLMTEDRANEMARDIVVDGRRARVVPGNRDGVPVWRVLLGPYDTRQAAERAGMASRLSYWVFEGAP